MNNYTHHFSTSFLAIHEALRDNIRRQQFIALFKLLKQNSTRKTLTTNANPFKDSVATQLIEDQHGVYFTSLKKKQTTIILLSIKVAMIYHCFLCFHFFIFGKDRKLTKSTGKQQLKLFGLWTQNIERMD